MYSVVTTRIVKTTHYNLCITIKGAQSIINLQINNGNHQQNTTKLVNNLKSTRYKWTDISLWIAFTMNCFSPNGISDRWRNMQKLCRHVASQSKYIYRWGKRKSQTSRDVFCSTPWVQKKNISFLFCGAEWEIIYKASDSALAIIIFKKRQDRTLQK